MANWEATIEAITVLESAYLRLLASDAPQVVRLIVRRAIGRLERDARGMLTGGGL